jgi:hypothetical protein
LGRDALIFFSHTAEQINTWIVADGAGADMNWIQSAEWA